VVVGYILSFFIIVIILALMENDAWTEVKTKKKEKGPKTAKKNVNNNPNDSRKRQKNKNIILKHSDPVILPKSVSFSNWDDPFKLLPSDVALYILSFLSVKDVSSTSRVRKKWNQLSNTDFLWREIFLKQYGHPKLDPKAPKSVNWKQKFIDEKEKIATEKKLEVKMLVRDQFTIAFRNYSCRHYKMSFTSPNILSRWDRNCRQVNALCEQCGKSLTLWPNISSMSWFSDYIKEGFVYRISIEGPATVGIVVYPTRVHRGSY